MSKPQLRALDLFCCAGGATKGLQRAGFHVTGVDIKPQPHYCGDEFHQADALTFPLDGFDFIWASPPCQGYSGHVSSQSSQWTPTKGKDEPRLISAMRERLADYPAWVIENVVGARSELRTTLRLCGTMFGLPIARHRLFETSLAIREPSHPKCSGVAKAYAAERGWEHRDMTVTGKGRRTGTKERWAEIMGVDWPMTQAEMTEAIPPAYAEYIGRAAIAHIGSRKDRSMTTRELSSRRADTVEAAEVVKLLREKHFMDDDTKARLPEAAADRISLFRRERSEAADLIASLSSQVEGLKVERDEARARAERAETALLAQEELASLKMPGDIEANISKVRAMRRAALAAIPAAPEVKQMTDDYAKPDDIEQDAWDAAEQVWLDLPGAVGRNAETALIARAILADRATRPAAVEDGPGEWRTIDSAPKDGTHVLVSFDGTSMPPTVAHWFGPPPLPGLRAGAWYLSVQQLEGPSINPTHWRDLPAPPSPTEGEAR